MEHDFTAKTDATLEREIKEHWRGLLDIVPLLPEDKALDAVRLMKRLHELFEEVQARMGTGTMEMAAKAEQLGNERNYLRRFLLQAVVICAEQDVDAIRPLVETIQEYLEVWAKQTLPSEKELRSRFDAVTQAVIAQKRNRPGVSHLS